MANLHGTMINPSVLDKQIAAMGLKQGMSAGHSFEDHMAIIDLMFPWEVIEDQEGELSPVFIKPSNSVGVMGPNHSGVKLSLRKDGMGYDLNPQ